MDFCRGVTKSNIITNNNEVKVDFGKYTNFTETLDIIADDICTKIRILANESGKDPYNRRFFAEPLVTFALTKEITELTMEEIYCEYVNWKLALVEYELPFEILSTSEASTDSDTSEANGEANGEASDSERNNNAFYRIYSDSETNLKNFEINQEKLAEEIAFDLELGQFIII